MVIQKTTGNAPSELEVPPIPPGTEHLLQTFMELRSARPSGGFGASAIPISEINAWQKAMNVRLTPWEVETLLHLDRAALAEMMDDKK